MMRSIMGFVGTILLLIISAGMNQPLSAADDGMSKMAISKLLSNNPDVRIYREDDGRITRIFGQQMTGGSSPADAAEKFKNDYAAVFGVDSDNLRNESVLQSKIKTLPLMYNKDTGQYKFTMVYYSQFEKDIPVYMSDLRILVLNQPGYPVVWAGSALKDLGTFVVNPTIKTVNPVNVQESFKEQVPYMINFTEPELVVWAGIDGLETPAPGVKFIADNDEPVTEKYLYIVDPITYHVIYKEDMIIDVDVSGQVNGLATEDFKAEQCGNEISTPLPYLYVNISGGSSDYTDIDGNFTIPNGGTSQVTVNSAFNGQYFDVSDYGGNNSSLSQLVTPPGPANFLHNPSNIERTRGEVNGYLHSNVVRDFTLTYHPTYPTIWNQLNFPVSVNRTDGFCPGNAWYDYSSINFCYSGSGYPNTAFSTIIHHEYGHHLVAVAGSGQGQYGEGMGDVMGLLITDDPGAAWGFFGPCNTSLRSAVNTIQYPCSGEIHYCGQLLSACVWDTRNELIVTNPSAYMDILAALAINSMPMHSGTEITPSITVDYLTLDDDDGNLDNGTPHYPEICAGFGAHNMDCPPIVSGVFITHTPLPDTESNSPYQVDAIITSTDGTINTAIINWSNGGAFVPVAMSNIGGDNYQAIIPGQSNCTTIEYNIYASDNLGNNATHPGSGYHAFFVGPLNILDSIFVDNIEGGTNGWTHSVMTSGYVDEWDIRNHRNHSSGGVFAWKAGSSSSSGTYANLSDGGLVTPVIPLLDSPTLTFWMWGDIENGYDGALVELAVNGGAFNQITPIGGYPSTTIGGYSHPWPAGTPCWTGSFGWTQVEFDLSSYANQNAQIRFRFGTDNSVQSEGWHIDDVVISVPDCQSIPPGHINGTVTNLYGAVENVHVTASGTSVDDYTDTSGFYSLNDLVPGSYNVSFSHIDHRDTTVSNVVITSDNTTVVDMILEELPGFVSGFVTDTVGMPLEGIYVEINTPTILSILNETKMKTSSPKDDGSLITALDSVYTDAVGFYSLTAPSSEYDVSFSHVDYYDSTFSGILVTPGDTTTLSISLYPINDAPMITSPLTAIATEDILFSYTATAIDPDGTTPAISFEDYASWLAVAGSVISGTPLEGYVDTLFTIIATDGELSDTAVVNVTLVPVNDPPQITSPDTATATEDEFFVYVASATDPEGVDPALSFEAYAAWMTVDADSIFGTPLEGDNNTSFTVIANDGELADTLLVSVTVISVNDAPVITSPDTASAFEDQNFIYVGMAEDPDGTTPIISYINYVSWLTVSGDSISGIPLENYQDTTFTLVAFDGFLADTLVINVTVFPVNDDPVITLDSTITFDAEDSAQVDLWAATYDPESPDSLLTYEFIVDNDSLIVTFTQMTGIMTLTSYPSYSGTVELAIAVTDPDNGSGADTILVIINSISGVDDGDINLPEGFSLEQNYPNPFNSISTISYGLPYESYVTLVIYDIHGRIITSLVNAEQPAGYHHVIWNAADKSSGVYFYKISAGKFVETRKMLLMK